MPRVRRLPRRLDDGSLQLEDQQAEDVTGGSTSHRWMQQSLACQVGSKTRPLKLARNIESVFIEVINTGNVPTTQNIQPTTEMTLTTRACTFIYGCMEISQRSAEPPVTLTVTGIADVEQLFTDNVVWLQLLPEFVSLLRQFLTLPIRVVQPNEVSPV